MDAASQPVGQLKRQHSRLAASSHLQQLMHLCVCVIYIHVTESLRRAFGASRLAGWLVFIVVAYPLATSWPSGASRPAFGRPPGQMFAF